MEKKLKRKKCELLVPAGGIKQFIAAVENGADAIYVGGKAFNARINAGNLDDDQMKDAIEFAHLRMVKVYVTMNTLVSDEELMPALEYAKFLYTIGVDALIIQDLGLARSIRMALPDLPLHLSTQATVYSPEGVKAAAKLGFERVVLARELSREEIKACVDEGEECLQVEETPTEIEVFVHGALCICYSGQCQMSRYMGGRSGNRGQCAQPCRLSYRALDETGRSIENFKYPLSPKDLCMVDYLGDYVDMGVASLKIEGRMKSPEYVAIVTRIYRKYLDLYYEKGAYVVSAEDRRSLEQIFNRGGFTEGYFNHNPGDELMSGDLPKHRGVKIGKVIKPVAGTALLDCKLYEELSIGDGVEIHNKALSGNIVTYLLPLKGGLTRIGDIKGKFDHGDEIYRISSKEQLKEAQRSFEFVNFQEGKYVRKTPIIMSLKAKIGEPLRLAATVEEGLLKYNVQVWEDGIIAERPIKTATDREQIAKQLKKTGNTPFQVRNVKIFSDAPFAVSVSSLNSLRRRAVEALTSKMTIGRELPKPLREDEAKAIWDCKPLSKENTMASENNLIELFFYDYKTFVQYEKTIQTGMKDIAFVVLLPIKDYMENLKSLSMVEAYPYISNLSKGDEDEYLRSNFDQIVKELRNKDKGIYVGNIQWIGSLTRAEVRTYGDFGLNIYNKETIKAYEALGITKWTASLEDETQYMGAAPLMISEHDVEGKYLVDRKGKHLNIIHRKDKTIIARDVIGINLEDAFSRNIKRLYVIEGVL